jgi:ribosome-binding protein aMBF1 (putative translation factor)
MNETEWQYKVNRIRDLAEWDDTQLAKKLSLSQPGISKIRRGLCIPHPRNRRKIDRLLAKLEVEQ